MLGVIIEVYVGDEPLNEASINKLSVATVFPFLLCVSVVANCGVSHERP